MAFSFIAGAKSTSDQSASPQSTAATLDIAAGDVLVCWLAYEDSTVATATVTDGGSNNFTMEAETAAGGGSRGRFGYVLNASANATATFTGTAGTAPYCGLYIAQFRPDAGETVTVDQKGTATGTGTSQQSATISTTGDDEIVLSGHKTYASASWSSPTIGGDASTAVIFNNGLTALYYKIYAATAANIYATVTHANSNWVCNIISIKSAAAAGGPVIPVFMNQYRQRSA